MSDKASQETEPADTYGGARPEAGSETADQSLLTHDASTNASQRFDSVVPIVGGALVVLIIGWVLGVAAPAADRSYITPTSVAESRKTASSAFDTAAARGRKLYVSEGCYTCHTQQVRPIITDAYLGPVTAPGDYAYDDPQLLGTQRIGPDLSHIGSRDLGKDAQKLGEYLRDPRKERPWSTMPSFAYLSDQELQDLVAYLQTLK